MGIRLTLLGTILFATAPLSLGAQAEIPTSPRERDYYAWITSVATAPHQAITPGNDSTNSRRYRLVVLTSEIYNTVIVEEIIFGREACCARVRSAREVDLDALVRQFQLRGERAGFSIDSSLSPTAFRVRFMGRRFDISNVHRQRVTVVQVKP